MTTYLPVSSSIANGRLWLVTEIFNSLNIFHDQILRFLINLVNSSFYGDSYVTAHVSCTNVFKTCRTDLTNWARKSYYSSTIINAYNFSRSWPPPPFWRAELIYSWTKSPTRKSPSLRAYVLLNKVSFRRARMFACASTSSESTGDGKSSWQAGLV